VRTIKVALLPVGGERKGREEKQSEEAAAYRKAVKQLLQDGGFYFSYDYDLTNSCVRLLMLFTSLAAVYGTRP
jgi:hypothetical protein